jgi:hypothetical protein
MVFLRNSGAQPATKGLYRALSRLSAGTLLQPENLSLAISAEALGVYYYGPGYFNRASKSRCLL